MELRRYVGIIWRWAWLILLGTILAGAAAFVASKLSTPVYQANTTLLVNQATQQTLVTDYTSVLTSQQLAATYSEMIKKRPVWEAVIEHLKLPTTPEELSKNMNVSVVRNTMLINISFEDKDPALAAGLLSQRRPRLDSPALDGLFIALDGPGDGDLRGPVESLEEARDLTAAVPDVEFLPEAAGDPIAGPDLARVAIGLGAVPEQVGDQAELLGSELGARPGARMRAEGLALPGPRGGQPLTDGPLGDAQGDGDVALLPALVSEVQGLHAPPLPPVVRSSA